MSNYRAEGVYLLHFSQPYKGAQHYLGWSGSIKRRVREHQRGHGVPLTRAVHTVGIVMQHVRSWPGTTRADEKRLRSYKGNNRLCPVCNPYTAFNKPNNHSPLTGEVRF
jgi:predicted GIY-YIG superfamily endonuclease